MALFLQAAIDPEYRGMIDDNRLKHQTYCERHGLDYQASFLDSGEDWFRIRLVLESLESGHDFVFWIDADAFVVDMSVDMRETVPEWAYLGMTIHPLPWDGQHFHFQTGVFYVRNSPMAREYFRAVLEMFGTVDYDQTAMNRLLMRDPKWQQGLRVLDHKWNWTPQCTDMGKPLVVGFHGRGNQRRALMREWANK